MLSSLSLSITVTHTLEIPYVYGEPALTSPNPSVLLLSEAMVDYWISFAVSLTPNDGKGVNSACSPCAHLRAIVADERLFRNDMASVPSWPAGALAVRHWQLRAEHHVRELGGDS